MSDTLIQIRSLAERGAIRISDHGYDELAEDNIMVGDILTGVGGAVVVEDYPAATRGPSVLVLQWDSLQRPVHVVWASPGSLRTWSYGDRVSPGSGKMVG